ncbi:hypothetical protein FJY84_06045 [Candidatus Bathyarchaeota archaeon]|nr:hypothetical protein [Candidatus Bathyarchaeota archaeon]
MKQLCKNCRYAKQITPELKLQMSQENKEIINKLLASRYKIDEFLYCEKFGYLESAIVSKDCKDWDQLD